ncbi:DUF3017 domain-containing protein [Actinokineospora globicatena]|uniref:DUF3017 domain-containing protein n=1 Tax=Actinokineospora globicatena TaxID=103729 RepID=A0A9W6VCB1_9PSEU|nr:DUF3017 domain-containing protein [Actinokineospora globicatena]MCP2301931.1 Protein of unknown function (DUF3017) [Actinokineospora globicatena]GLW76410.1 hypothetical protein Aglo01_08920 [Actinokineospora globicatena]GLW83245.1 hypothetical protein Aglo02_08850 [Actinokineospora globicatena]GLW94774.1 hypothetical protein Aglo03_55900 [Actinokineospora globicatena]
MNDGPQRGGKHPVLVHLPFALVMAVVVLGLVRIIQFSWREGTVWIGLALLLAAGLRALLRDEQAGLVAIRGRAVDVLLYGLFGVVVIAVALTIEGGWLSR